MKKVENVYIESLSHEGRGITHLNGKTYFVEHALAQETVTIEVKKNRRKYSEAKVIEVIQPSPLRVTPACSVYQLCGGCSLQHMGHSAQVQFKQQVVLEQLQHLANCQPNTLLPPILGEPYGYRGKARLGVRYVEKKGKVLVGFRERQGRYLTDTSSCAILHESVGNQLTQIQTLIASLDAYREIAQIEVAVGHHATALVFRNLIPLNAKDTEKLVAFAQAHNFWLYLQPGGQETVHRIYGDNENHYLSYQLPEQNLELLFEPLDFTQVNQSVNQKIVTRVLELLNLQKNETVLDLFCGLGNFSLPMAQQCQTVVAVEGDKAMVERGVMNAQHNGLNNITFHQGDLMVDLKAPYLLEKYDAVLLDPPRSGASAIIQQIANLQPKRIVYVSCHPATMARDIAELQKKGYTLQTLSVADMFTQTSHIESIALLSYG